MLYFFYGENHKDSLEHVNAIIARFKEKNANHIPHMIDCEEITASELDTLLGPFSLFGNVQLFILKHLLNAKHLHNFFSNKVEPLKNTPNSVAVIWERAMPEKSELFTLLLKHARHKEFKGIKKATPKDNSLYNLADSWALKAKGKSFLIFHTLLSRGVAKERIFWTLIWHIRNLLAIQDSLGKKNSGMIRPPAEIAKSTGLHPFIVRKGITELRYRSHDSLRSAFSALCSIDENVKRGRVKLETAILHFLLTY